MGNRYPLVANTDDLNQAARLIVRKWLGALVELSWAEERPQIGSALAGGSTIFDEQILLVRIKSCSVLGRRSGQGEVAITLWLEVDSDAVFAKCGRIDCVHLDLVATTSDNATVHFRIDGAPASGAPASITARLKRIDED